MVMLDQGEDSFELLYPSEDVHSLHRVFHYDLEFFFSKSFLFIEEMIIGPYLSDIMEQTRVAAADENEYHIQFFARRIEPFEYAPEELERVAKKSEEMNFMELLAYIRNVEAEGYDATNYRVDLHAKLAFPVVCLVLSFVAGGYGIKRRGRRGAQGLSVSIGFGLGVTFLYWVFFNFF